MNPELHPETVTTDRREAGQPRWPATALDTRHITEVCTQVVAATPHMGAPYAGACACHADRDGVTAVLPSPDMRLNATRALHQHGYDTADPPGDDPRSLSSVRVTGWSPTRLDRRVRDLRLAVDQLERTLPTTITNTVGAYLGLRGHHGPGKAETAPAVAAAAEIRNEVEQATGPVVTTAPRADQVPEAIRERLDEVGRLGRRVADLIDLHREFAKTAVNRMEAELRTTVAGSAPDRVIAETCADAEHRLRTERFREAWHWADEHLPAVNAVPFAQRYIEAYGPRRPRSAAFAEAAARWGLDRRDDASTDQTAPASVSTPRGDATVPPAADFPGPPVADAPPAGQGPDPGPAHGDGAHRSPGSRP